MHVLCSRNQSRELLRNLQRSSVLDVYSSSLHPDRKRFFMCATQGSLGDVSGGTVSSPFLG